MQEFIRTEPNHIHQRNTKKAYRQNTQTKPKDKNAQIIIER